MVKIYLGLIQLNTWEIGLLLKLRPIQLAWTLLMISCKREQYSTKKCMNSNKHLAFMSQHVIKKARVNPLQEGEDWKPNMIKEICLAKKGFLDIELENGILDDLLESISTE